MTDPDLGPDRPLPQEAVLPPGADVVMDRYARMVRAAVGVPTALVTLVTRTGQVFPGAVGLPQPYQDSRQTPLSHSFCQHVVRSGQPLVVADARDDPLVADNPAIDDLRVVAYAGVPLRDADGTVVGSLCAVDGRVHDWTGAELAALADLAAACSSELALRRTVGDLTRARTALEGSAARLEALSQAALALAEAVDVPTLMQVVVERGLAAVGCAGGAVAVIDPAQPDTILSLLSTSFGGGSQDEYGRLPLATPLPVGVVARTGRAVLLPDRAACAAFPGMDAVVEATGATAFASLPMVVEGRVLGVLTAGWAQVHVLDDPEVEVLQAFAAQCALALARIRERDVERLTASRQAAMAEALQRSLLTAVAQPDGLRVAARYRASGAEAQVGGDWYDAFVVPTGALTLVVGDVTGHDQQAAAVMGQLRNLLRGVSHVLAEPPAAVLSRLDLVMRDLEVGAFATAVLAAVEPAERAAPGGGRLLTWSSAGHLPPLLVRPGRGAELLETESDLLLGLDPGTRRADHGVDLAPGSLLVLYTDGLVERRGVHVQRGLDWLVQEVDRWLAAPGTRREAPDPQSLADWLLAVVDHHADDDVVLLALATDPA